MSVKYYGIIGIGIGILGIILLNQFGGGGGTAGGIIGGFLSVIIFTYAVLTAPIIAGFVGYVIDQEVKGESRMKIINSAIANGIGYVVFGLTVGVLLVIGVSLILGGDGGALTGGSTSANGGSGSSLAGISNVITLIALMMVPNALIGGGITAVSNNTSSKNGDIEAQTTTKNHTSQTNETVDDKNKLWRSVTDLDIPRKYVGVFAGIFVLVILIMAGAPPVIEYTTASPTDLTASGELIIQQGGYGSTVEITNPTNKDLNAEMTTQLIINEEYIGSNTQTISISSGISKEITYELVSSDEVTAEHIQAINRGDFEIRYNVRGGTIGSSKQLSG